ncbi:hypothetical protein HYC85_016026 [Camellia sinensis]|uniref:Uncharacterized protein n=1 Tax=Camellia sinensis TaxID=4442 RepID=A0A7J7H254_CAMSI|nr:hypothetical protein HYC85_016026 [Camellia sinensis]
MYRASSSARVSDEFLVNLLPAAKASPVLKSSASGDLHVYDQISDAIKKEISPLQKSPRSWGENVIHLIPLILILCGLILWFFSSPIQK